MGFVVIVSLGSFFPFVISRILLLLGIVTYLNSTSGKLRQEDQKILASVVYTVRPCLEGILLLFSSPLKEFFFMI